MATLTAIQMLDPSRGFDMPVWFDRRGSHGTRHYRVNTQDPAQAVLANALPRIGDSWDPANNQLAGLVAVKVGPAERLGGRDAGDGAWPDGVGSGWCRVPVEYESAQVGGSSVKLPDDAKAQWTELVASTMTVPVYSALDSVEFPNNEPFQLDVGQVEARVVTHYGAGSRPPLDRFLKLMGDPSPGRPGVTAVNDAPLALPAVYGTSVTFTLAAGQARYKSFSLDQVNSLLQVTHVLSLAYDHLCRGRTIGADGVRSGSDFELEGYPKASFAGLWR